jgi:hypothetical protein
VAVVDLAVLLEVDLAAEEASVADSAEAVSQEVVQEEAGRIK